jgi:hypothetical protein
MRTPIRIVLGILVTGIVLASTLFALAQTKSRPLTSYPLINVARSRAAVNRDWQLGAPVSFQTLTVFPVITDRPVSADEYITLDQGLRAGKVTVSEIGANGRARRIRQGGVSDSAEVNRLLVKNTSGKMLVLIAGEIIVGGKQDRIVGEDCVIASGPTPVPVDVFCVEHGRWDERSRVGQSRGGSSDTPGGQPSGGTPGGVIGTFSAPAKGGMAAPKTRAQAQAEKSQSGVWAEVSKLEGANSVSSSTGTLNKVYEDRRVSARLDDYERAIKNKLVGKNVIGAVAAIDGQVVSADVFANPKLFQAYWPKLLTSYALEAISTGKRESKSVDRVAAAAFLARVEAPASSEGKKAGHKLTEYQSDRDASFELESDDKNAGKLIHFNRVNKR